MLSDALTSKEIFPAFMLYASLHGLKTDEQEVRERIKAYLNNQPDTQLDEAIYAFEEGKIEAPPDVVVPFWGKSRIYTIRKTQLGEFRHDVLEDWFEQGCEFRDPTSVPKLAHFWTIALSDASGTRDLAPGTRLGFSRADDVVLAYHRQESNPVGRLTESLAPEIIKLAEWNTRFLVFLESIDSPAHLYKLFVCIAGNGVETAELLEYAELAFSTPRNRC